MRNTSLFCAPAVLVLLAASANAESLVAASASSSSQASTEPAAPQAAEAAQNDAPLAAAVGGEGSAALLRTSPTEAPILEREPIQAPLELGLFVGLFFPASDHRLESRTHEAFDSPSVELGGRMAAYPIRYLGLELEAAGIPTSTRNTDSAGGIWAARAHLLGQLPFETGAVFALFGGGALGAATAQTGSDVDPALHFGVGGKYWLDDVIGLRLDLRDTLSQKSGAPQNTLTHHPEVLLGLSFGMRAPRTPLPPPPAPPRDSDRDGVIDVEDGCPEAFGPAPAGCPDTDGDGLLDNKDACVDQKGLAPCGCPPRDADGDKVIDEFDSCPLEAGPIMGCPDPDPDRDGVVGAADLCPDKRETVNGFDDSDGCPDEVPEKVKKFTGVIKGIEFDRGTEKIRPVSASTLDGAAAVLTEFPQLRVLISGHTDTDGARDYNLDLSRRRAESVKAYFVGKGISAERIETRGVGPDEPIGDNKTAAGKQMNRRIEFKLLEGAAPPKGEPQAWADPATESSPAKPTEGKPPAEAKAPEAKAPEAKAPETAPAGTRLAEAKPVEVKAPEPKPAEAKPVQPGPAPSK